MKISDPKHKISCLSDLHGNLVPIEDCDLVILAGDLAPFGSLYVQIGWLNGPFREWLEKLRDRNIPVVGIAGNHDEVFDKHLAPELPWTYLEDKVATINGLRIWGTPWSLPYGKFPFMKEEDRLRDCYGCIPEDINIIISHGPPYGYGDQCPDYFSSDLYLKNAGSFSLLETIDRVRPKLVVFGHIHQGRGLYERGETLLCNATIWSHVSDKVNPPLVVYL